MIESDYRVELMSDPYQTLNFMLDELMVKAPPDRFYEGVTQTLIGSEFDQELSPADVGHVRVDKGAGGGGSLQFRADGVALETSWPPALRIEELDGPRLEVEQARNAAVEELKSTGKLSPIAAQALREKLDVLTDKFSAKYPRERRLQSTAAFLEYLAGERFLQAFAVGVHRMVMEEDQSAFDGSLVFRGESVAGLIGHMHRLGLKFAPWQPGDEGTYRKLFTTMRNFYLQFSGDNSG
jgi:hypothetical protein